MKLLLRVLLSSSGVISLLVICFSSRTVITVKADNTSIFSSSTTVKTNGERDLSDTAPLTNLLSKGIESPTNAPTGGPTASPTNPPSKGTESPSNAPTGGPTASPTNPPSKGTESPSSNSAPPSVICYSECVPKCIRFKDCNHANDPAKCRKQCRHRCRKKCPGGVVIVGGGVGGTYLAWRLSTAKDSYYKPNDIHLFERTDHVSGRLYSPTIGDDLCQDPEGNLEGYLPRTELGGMRVRTKDKILNGVIKKLRIKTGPFFMNAQNKSETENSKRPMFTRNALGTAFDFLEPKKEHPKLPYNKIPYVLRPPPPIVEPHLPKIPSDFDPCDGNTNAGYLEKPFGIDPDTMQPFYTYSLVEAGHEFYGFTSERTQYENLQSGYFSFENYDIGQASAEGTDGGELNRPSIIQQESPNEYIRPLKGMADVPISLHAAAKDINTNLNQEVTRIEQLEDGMWKVTFMPTITNECTGITMVQENAAPRIIIAEKVVLALPAAALERIQFITPQSDGSLRRTINELTNQVSPLPLMKLFAAWDERWWETVENLDTFSPDEMPEMKNPTRSTNFTCGRFINDVVNQVFAWYPGTQSRPRQIKKNAPGCSDMGVLQLYLQPEKLQIYSSATNPVSQMSCGDDESSCDACSEPFVLNRDWFSKGISRRLVKLLTQDLMTIFRQPKVPEPADIKYRIWHRDDPVTRSDAVHFWRSDLKWWNETYKIALEPTKNLHLIGEVFSHNQGWAEGALETAEHLLQEVMGFERPQWLDKKDYCRSMPFYIDRKN